MTKTQVNILAVTSFIIAAFFCWGTLLFYNEERTGAFILSAVFATGFIGLGFFILQRKKSDKIKDVSPGNASPLKNNSKEQISKLNSETDKQNFKAQEQSPQSVIPKPPAEPPTPPKFANKEEYEKWKAEKIKQSKETSTSRISGHKIPIKSKGKYGIGWLFLVLGFVNIHKEPLLYNFHLNLVDEFMIIPLLIIYFKIRNKFLKKKAYEQKKWQAAVAAYICTVFIYGVLHFPLLWVDSSVKWKDFSNLVQKYSEMGVKLKDEEKSFVNGFIQEPKTTEELKYNINLVNNFLLFIERKHNIAVDFFKDLKRIFRADKKRLITISTSQLLSGKIYETQKKHLEFLSSYYSTGDERFLNESSKFELQLESLISEYEKSIKEIIKEI